MRLTNKERDEALAAFDKEKYQPKVEALRAELTPIADALAAKRYTPKIREWLDAAPKGGVHSRETMYLKWSVIDDDDGEKRFYRIINDVVGSGRWDNLVNVRLSKPLKMIAADQYTDFLSMETDSKEGKQVGELLKRADAIHARHQKNRAVVMEALYACTTRKQLEERYPKLVKYLPAPVVRTKALAVTAAAVEEALGDD